MSTNFSSLPVVDLTPLRGPKASQEDKARLSSQLYDVFSTTGFAYLVNAPLSFDHDALFTLARDFFSLPLEHKMKLAKKSFKKENKNTYRGYSSFDRVLSRDAPKMYAYNKTKLSTSDTSPSSPTRPRTT